MKIYETELCIVYDLDGDLLQFRQSTSPDSTLKMSILDKEQEHSTGETSVELNDMTELKICMTDFEVKFNSLKTNKIRTN